MLRILKLAEQRGHGEKLLAWLDESGVGERYWPLRAAFEAYVYGEAKLRDVNPEVRAAASHIYASLDRLRKGRAGAVTGIDPLVTDFLNDVKAWRNEHGDY